MPKLTVKEVTAAKPKKSQYTIGDGGGLYLVIKTSGAKSWVFRYTRPNTKKISMIGLGSLETLGLAQAREKAAQYKKMVADGVDPQAYKSEAKAQAQNEAANTFLAIAKLWAETKRGSVKPATLNDNWRKLELHALPHIGNTLITAINAPATIAALRPLEAAGKLETVQRLTQLINEIMVYAVNSGLIFSNPLAGIREVFKKPKSQHMAALPPHELPRLLKVIAHASITQTVKCLIEFQLHTMTRPNEAAGAKWAEFDLTKGIWEIPAERMKMNKPHIVPLTPQVLAILEVMKPLSARFEYVFPSRNNPHKATSPNTINRAFTRTELKGEQTAHGLRSIAATTLNNQGFNRDVIDTALAHTVGNQVSQAYNRANYLEQRIPLMSWWSSHIETASYGSVSITGTKHLKAV